MIRCPASHWFNWPIECLTWERTDQHDPGTAASGERSLSGPQTAARPALMGVDRPVRWDSLVSEPSAVSTAWT
jgi:hypothetical protein